MNEFKKVAMLEFKDGSFAIVDIEDYDKVKHFRWYKSKSSRTYMVYTVGPDGSKKYLHNFLLESPDGCVVDHKNGHGYDNRRENLRVATYSQNSMNKRGKIGTKSGYKGVRQHNNKWQARLTVNGKLKSLGMFQSRHLAAKAYNEEVLKEYKSFARLNTSPELRELCRGGYFENLEKELGFKIDIHILDLFWDGKEWQ